MRPPGFFWRPLRRFVGRAGTYHYGVTVLDITGRERFSYITRAKDSDFHVYLCLPSSISLARLCFISEGPRGAMGQLDVE